MSGIFNPDNWFWRGFGRLADYFILSVLWMVCSVPVITTGAACIALYDAVVHSFRMGEDDMVKRFFSAFKRELLRGVLLTVLWAALCLLLNMGYQIILQLSDGSMVWRVFSIVYYVTLFVPLGAMCWVVSLESRFTYTFRQLHTTAVLFTFGHLPYTAAIVALLVVVLNVLINFPYFLMFLPAILAHLQSFFIEKVFHKYMSAEETEIAEIEE